MSQHVEKSRKKPLIFILIAAIVVLAVVLALLLTQFTDLFGGKATEPSTEPTETTTEENVILYWNVDRALYAGQAEDGLTSRTKDEDTGYYLVNLAAKGRVSTRRVLDRRVANKIDEQDVMGIVLNDDGVVIDIQTIEECTGGYGLNGFKTYVDIADGYNITTYASEQLVGVSFQFSIDGNTKVYDVSGESEPVGASTTLRNMDQILVILNKDGSVGWVYILDREPQMPKETRYCQHCQEEVQWYGWVKEDGLPVSGEGHYFLTCDVACTTQQAMAADANIVLDLNGHTVQGKDQGTRIYSLHNEGAYLCIMDTSKEGTGKLVSAAYKGETNQGACVWVRYGTFDLYSGTLDGSAARTGAAGGTVCVNTVGTFNMYGGTIIGGTSVTGYNASTDSTTGGLGGAVRVDGLMNMYDGLITGGSAEAYYMESTAAYRSGLGGNVWVNTKGVVNMTGGTIIGGTATSGGGNVYLSGGGQFHMSGDAQILDGEITAPGKNGGSVYIVKKAVFTMDGGTISGGITRNCGGVMVVYGTLNMNGGTISGGKVLDSVTGKEKVSNNENLFVVNGTLNMTGGLIKGHVQLITTGDNKNTVNISGTAQIKGAEDNCANLYIPGGDLINVGTMKKGAEVYVTASGIFSAATADANKQYFHHDSNDIDIQIYEKCLFAGRFQCLCGAWDGEHHGECDGTQLAFGAWTSSTSLPTTTGNYYLTKDVTCNQQNINGDGTNVVLDLNGHTVTGNANKRIYALFETEGAVSLTITDSSENQTGKMVLSEYDGLEHEGGIVWLRPTSAEVGHTLNIYTGTFDASGVICDKSGAAINAAAGSTFNMYGGTLIGGTARGIYTETTDEETGEVTGTTKNGFGGTMYLAGTFNMYGGVIKDGYAVAVKNEAKSTEEKAVYERGFGGNIFVSSNGVVNLRGGTIENGKSDTGGGNIFFDGSKYDSLFSGVQILNGTSGNQELGLRGDAGNVYFNSEATLTIEKDTLIDGATAYNNTSGGNMYIGTNATVVMTGGTVSNGSATRGGNICCFGKLYATGGKLLNGTGSSLFVGNYAEVELTNVTIDGGTGNIGGNIAFYGEKAEHQPSVTLNAGTVITNGTAKGNGGNIYLTYGKLTINEGAEVSNGTSGSETTATHGGNIYVGTANASLVMNGGKVSGGVLASYGQKNDKNAYYESYGGNIAIINARGFEMNGGEISGGKAHRGGNVCILIEKDRDAFEYAYKMTGGEISGGTSTFVGGNFCVATTNEATPIVFDMTGGKITGGAAVSGGNVGIGAGGESTVCYASFNVSGNAEITDGVASLNGGNFYVHTGCSLNLSDNALVSGGTAQNNGGNIYIVSSAASAFTGNAKIENGTAGYDAATDTLNINTDCYGGNIYIKNTQLTIQDNVLISGGSNANEKTNCGTYIKGGNLSANGTAVVTMTGGTIQNGSALYGGNVHLAGGSTMNMSGGEIKDGFTYADDRSGENYSDYTGSSKVGWDGRGGNIAMGGATLKLTGDARITGGYAEKGGGNVEINSASAVLTMADNARIADGESGSSGGNLFVRIGTKVAMNGGAISGGKAASSGGSIYLSTVGKTAITVNGGTIAGGTAPNGGNIYADTTGAVTITGGTITGGTATDGGNIYAAGNAVVNVTGGEISNGTATNGNGGNISLNGSAAMTVSGTADSTKITGGQASGNGGSIYLSAGSRFTMEGGTVTGGQVSKRWVESDGNYQDGRGGNIYVAGICDLKGGTVSNGVSESNGGNIDVHGISAEFYLNGAAVTGGKAGLDGKQNGGNIDVFDANAAKVFQINSGVISNGIGHRGANVYIAINGSTPTANCDFEMNGGEIYGSTGTYNGAGICLYNNSAKTLKFTMNGGKIYNNTVSSGNGGNIALGAGGTSNLVGQNIEFIMNGGEISGGSCTGYGGNIYISGKSTFTLNGGTITGGSTIVSTTANKDGRGGNVAVINTAKFIMNNGTVSNGTVNSTGTGCANGGNVYLGDTATFTMNNGTVSGGKTANTAYNGKTSTANHGGNIYVISGATFRLNGGSVSDGYAANNGGNIASFGTLNMTGGAITGGSCGGGKATSNIFLAKSASNTAKLIMSGGTIDGDADIYVFGDTSEAPVQLSGNATINLSANGNGLHLVPVSAYVSDCYVEITDELSGTIRLTFTSGMKNQLAVKAAADYNGGVLTQADLDHFAVPTGYLLNLENGAGWLRDKTAHLHCVCGALTVSNLDSASSVTHAEGCDGSLIYWEEWDGSTVEAGHYYMSSDKTIGAQLAPGSASSVGGEFCLCTNGYTLSSSDRVAMARYNWTLTFTDCATRNSTGTLKGALNSDIGGLLLLSNYSGFMDANGNQTYGTIHVYNVALEYAGTGTKNGGIVNVSSGCTFYMNNVTMSGGNASVTADGSTTYFYGGSISNSGTARIVNSTISGGKGSFGGNIYNTGTLTIINSTIKNGYAYNDGGNIWSNSSFTMEGTTVSGGQAPRNDGGNILVQGKDVIVEATDCTISNGTSNWGGSNIMVGWNSATDTKSGYCNTKLILNNCTVSGGQSNKSSGSIYVRSESVVEIIGGTISGGVTNTVSGSSKGGNIVANVRSTVTIKDATVSGGRAAGNGGNISVEANATLNMTNCTVKDGSSKDSGGNIAIFGTATLTDCTISGGTAAKNANSGNLFINSSKDVTMDGGSIDGLVLVSGASTLNSFTLSGDLVINSADKVNVTLGSGNLITVGELKEGAMIGITGSGVISNACDAGSENYFKADDACEFVVHNGTALAISHQHCLCGAAHTAEEMNSVEHAEGCTKTLLVYTASSTLPAKGADVEASVYLTSDITVSAQINYTSDSNVNICLNGHTVTVTGTRIFSVRDNSTMTVTSCDGTGSFDLNCVPEDAEIGAFIHFYSTETQASGQNVLLFNLDINGEDCNMRQGGIIHMTQAIASLTANNVTFTGADAANYVSSKTTADSLGGTMYIDNKAIVNLYDCTVQGGTATYGGNIYLGGSAKLNLVNTTVTGGAATEAGDNIYIAGTTAQLTVGGNTVIDDDAVSNVYLPGGSSVAVSAANALTDGASIGITGYGTVVTGAAEADAKYFTGDDAAEYIGGYDGTASTLSVVHAICDCGRASGAMTDGERAAVTHLGTCDGTLHTYTPWTTTTNVPAPKTSANYYLVTDVTMTTKTNSMYVSNVDFRFDLNGHTVLGPNVGASGFTSGSRIWQMRTSTGSTATNYNIFVTDSSTEQNGKIVGRFTSGEGDTKTDQGMIWWDYGSGTANNSFTLYGGTIDGSAFTNCEKAGALFSVSAKSSLNIHGGTIIGGTTTQYGGTVCCMGTMTMTGGTIKGGTSGNHGGNVYIPNTGSFTMSGGKILNGTSVNGNGGNLFCYGKFTMTGGEISGGTGLDGLCANVQITANNASSCVVKISGGMIDGQMGVDAKVSGSNTYVPVVTFSGTPVIASADNLSGLRLGNAGTAYPAIKLAGLTEGARIVIIPVADGKTVATDALEADMAYLHSGSSSYTLARSDTGIVTTVFALD